MTWYAFTPSVANSSDSLPLNSELSTKTINNFAGEKLIYDISFLWFKNAAEGVTTLQQDENGYVAKLEAKTKGFIGFFTGFIKHFYVSHMKLVEDNMGLQPYTFEKNVIFQGDEEKIITNLDYESRTLSWLTTKKGKLIEEKDEPIPVSMIYYDVLSAFYNFRTSYYGKVQKGKDFLIHAIPEKNESEIRIHVATREEELKFKKEEKIEDSEGYFLMVKIPKAFFKTKKGTVLIWTNKELVPLHVVVRDYVGFGDVRGKLREVVQIEAKSRMEPQSKADLMGNSTITLF